jgi:hypothetical protein
MPATECKVTPKPKATSSATRRTFLAGGAALLTAPMIGRQGAHAATPPLCRNAPVLAPQTPQPQRAVSLRRISEALSAGRPATFDRLTRLDGYVLDAPNNDIVLWGLSEPDQPNLHVDDFIIALRSLQWRYSVRENNTNYRISPLISIDPDPEMYRQLRKLNVATPEGRRQFDLICRRPQVVRVEGMPRHSRLAKVLVDADYRMKLVGQGQVELPIASPFQSSFAGRIERYRQDSDAGVTSKPYNTRYWFEAGRFSCQQSAGDDTIFVDIAQVVLKDENQSLTGKGLSAAGDVDEITRAFTCAWTERMEDTYRAEPIWRDMHNIFRHFAVARAIRDNNALDRVNFAGEYLLDKHVLGTVHVAPTLPGTGRVADYVSSRGGKTSRLYTNVCGGVSVGFGDPIEKKPDAGRTGRSGRSAVVSRPAPTALSWSVDASRGDGPATHAPQSPRIPGGPSAALPGVTLPPKKDAESLRYFIKIDPTK